MTKKLEKEKTQAQQQPFSETLSRCSREDRGQIVYVEFESKVLRDNSLGDPYVRSFPVYLPPKYSEDSAVSYPVLFALAAFTSTGASFLNKKFLSPALNEILDELILQKNMPPVICVMPDCMTYFGGSQYVNSSAVGRYEDYMVQELVPFIDGRFRSNQRRACFGSSSGGLGSFLLAVKHPDIFQAFADHCGDSAFEYCYLTDVPKFIQALAGYDFQLENFAQNIHQIQPHDGRFMALLNMTAMAACYSPNPNLKPLGFELPFDPYTGKLNREIFQRWLEFDPVRIVENKIYQDNLKKLSGVFLDCGRRDQFHLYLGARQLHQKLSALGVEHIYDEYDSDHHLLVKTQMKKSLPFLAQALTRSALS